MPTPIKLCRASQLSEVEAHVAIIDKLAMYEWTCFDLQENRQVPAARLTAEEVDRAINNLKLLHDRDKPHSIDSPPIFRTNLPLDKEKQTTQFSMTWLSQMNRSWNS